MQLLRLDDFRNLFRDDAAYNEFVEKFAPTEDLQPVLVGSKVIGLMLSADRGKSYLMESLAKRLLKNPELLDELTKDR